MIISKEQTISKFCKLCVLLRSTSSTLIEYCLTICTVWMADC